MAARVGHTPDGEEKSYGRWQLGMSDGAWCSVLLLPYQASLAFIDPYAFTVLSGGRRCGDALPAAGGSRRRPKYDANQLGPGH